VVSIIILSWNRKADTLITLDSLKCQSYKDYEVILVDQGSNDGTPEAVREKFPEVNIVKLHRNSGVPFGRNVGAINARGDILVFVDNDASMDCNALKLTVGKFLKENDLGIIGFRILNAFTQQLDLSSWFYPKNKLKDSNNEFYTYTFCGCGHAIRKELFKKIGFYWDDLFFSWEEVDLSLKAMNAGYKIVYDPNIVVYHRIAKEKRTSGDVYECLRLRNSLWVTWRYIPFCYACKESVARICGYLIKSIRKKCFIKMLLYLFMSFSKINLIFNRKYKISRTALKEYRILSEKGPFIEELTRILFK
jgi:hypothetical protein